MKIDTPFGVTSLEIGAITVYTLKLRFNSGTYSWIKPELDSCDPVHRESILVTQRNGYITIRLETSSYNIQESVWKAIQRGQIAQQEHALEWWKEHGIRPDVSKMHKPVKDVGKINLSELHNT